MELCRRYNDDGAIMLHACPCFGQHITSVHERVHTSNTIAIANG